MTELTERWATISTLLRDASRALPARFIAAPTIDPAGAIAQFEEFLSHNELELAWDVLESIADGHADTAPVWFYLAEAANLMELSDHKERAIRKLIETWPAKDAPFRLGFEDARPRRKSVGS